MEANKQIPSDWVRKVCNVLESRNASAYRVSIRAYKDLESIFPLLFMEQMLDVIVDVLRHGKYTDSRNVVDFNPEGNTYEFLFPYCSRRMYGKIILMNNIVFVDVISVHLQEKDDIQNGRFT